MRSNSTVSAGNSTRTPKALSVASLELRKRDNADVPAGQGDVDFKSIIPVARKAGWPIIVEYEADGAIEAVRQSSIYLKTL